MNRVSFSLFLFLAGAGSALAAPFPRDSWERLPDHEAEALGWSRDDLGAMWEHAEAINTEAVLIVVGGKVLESRGPIERKFKAHSIRKSLLGALYGIQVEAGRIQLEASLAELAIVDNEPSLTAVEQSATIRHLLQSRSGVYHPALYETRAMKAARPGRHSHAPGEFWYYNNWDFNALGTIYEEATGNRIHADFERLIANPLGMEDYESDDGAYVTGEDSIHPAYPFRISARDLARFGLLFLREGEWDGRQVVAAEWVLDSLTPWSEAGTRGSYGYLWWLERNGIHLPGVTLPPGSYTARGAGGHYLLVVPALDLVVVHRVDTDVSGNRVESSEFGELVRRLFLAHTPRQVAGEPVGALDTLIPLLMSRHRVPGAAVIGIRRGEIASESYHGTREAGKDLPVGPETVFEAASMTKPLAAQAALKLAEKGELELDRPLASYLEELWLSDQPEHTKITARMVLSHTSGFPNWRPRGKALEVLHEPGTAYRYSGEGFRFLQHVIEALTGEEYGNYIERTLLRPLGAKSSSHVWREGFSEVAAAGHDDRGRVREGRRHYNRANAAFTLYTTPRDYAAFVLALMNPNGGDGHSLGEESLALMLAPASPPTGRELFERSGKTGEGEVRYGLGWAIEPCVTGRRIRHSGSNGTGFRCHVEFDPAAGHGLLIMTNATGGAAFWKELLRFAGVP